MELWPCQACGCDLWSLAGSGGFILHNCIISVIYNVFVLNEAGFMAVSGDMIQCGMRV